uniref:Uncharacterized protein n=1 Tax=Talaromyces marneffei PM1 TaxID=1077442 RepID=A0A093VZD3_TALMA
MPTKSSDDRRYRILRPISDMSNNNNGSRYFVIASVIKARSWGERAIPNTESMTFATVATPSMGTVPTVGFKCYTDARDAGATIDPLVSTSMGKIAKPAGTSTAEPEAEPPGVLGIASIKRFDGASRSPFLIPTATYANKTIWAGEKRGNTEKNDMKRATTLALGELLIQSLSYL